VTPDGLKPAGARLLWLAAHADWCGSWDLAALARPPLSLAEVHDVLSGWAREGWAGLFNTGGVGWFYSLTAAGRLAAARYTPALLHHAGACVGAEHCPVCKGAA
jgi:hypothetical protein